MVRIHQPAARRDDAMPIGVRVVADGDVEPVLEPDQIRHRVRRRAVHADAAVVIERHEAERRVDDVVRHVDLEPVSFGNRQPQRHGRAAERIDADTKTGVSNGGHVDDGVQVGDVRVDEVKQVRGVGGAAALVARSDDTGQIIREQVVGAPLDPLCDGRLGRPAGRRVVFQAAVFRRIV
jgi:hypothetical protein